MNDFRHLAFLRYDSHRLVKSMLTEFRMGRGLRIGETTVISRRVHVIYPQEPEEVKIIINQDALYFRAFRSQRKLAHLASYELQEGKPFYNLIQISHI
jgi:hypothetical protein